MSVALVVVQGRPKGAEIPIPGPIFAIGRDARCQLRPRNELVSNRHCAIVLQDASVYVRDLNSTNGTFVNGRRIEHQVEVRDGDVLRVANLGLAFKIQADELASDLTLSTQSEQALTELAKSAWGGDTVFDFSFADWTSR